MKEKYNMPIEENLEFAKRKLADNIYKSANLEGISITIAETFDILNNINVGNLSVDEMLKVVGLRDSWAFIFDTYNEELTTNYIKTIHENVCKGQNVYPLGEYRNTGVGITGTDWRPKLPSECDYDKELAEIMKNDSPLDTTLDLFCWIQKSQMFKDGNKRVANLVANKEMIKNGLGIIAIPVELKGTYLSQLVKYYETNDNNELKQFLYDRCLDGIEFDKEIDIDME